jgi:hypothetical protein
MERNSVDKYLSEALEADDPSEKDYHVRQAKQCDVLSKTGRSLNRP